MRDTTAQQHKTTTAVITGGHSFDVIDFHRLFRALEGVNAYIQHLDDFCSSPEEVRDSYDVVLFYGMPTETPSDDGQPGYAGKPRTALEHLGETGQGIVILHHGSLAYREWSVWSEIVGIQDRTFGYHPNQTLHVEIANPQHPITTGLSAWDIVDEAYTMDDAGPGSEVLLTVDHPNCMKTIAWTRDHKNARVFCLQLGHDDQAWADPTFRTVLTRGIRWAAGPDA
jgi:type 1 glutamine amidotransferase